MITGKVCRHNNISSSCENDDTSLKWGDDINDQLITEELVLLERGRVEIDSEFTNRKDVTISLHQSNFIQPGSSILIAEGINSNTGMLKNININFSKERSLSAGSIIKIERNV